MAKFYNPGQKIYDRLQYTHPTKDPKEGNTLSYYLMDAPEKEFFDVPDTVMIDSPEGELQVPVNFGKRVKALYQSRGVIQVMANRKDILEDDNAATTEKEAKVKGDAMWREYLKGLAQEHVTRCEEIRSMGNVPRGATGLTKYAIDAVGMNDPALSVETFTRAKEGQKSDAETQKQISDLTALVHQLKGALETKRS